MTVEDSIAASNLAGLMGTWHRDGSPAYEALATRLRSLILSGGLPIRIRLPSERALAAALAVSRTTTTGAYYVLREEGFLESRRGSGSRIALPTGGTREREFGRPPRGAEAAPAIDLTVAALPAPALMTEAVAAATRDLVTYLGGSGYDPAGIAPLRRAIARDYEARGVPTGEEQIVVTSGAQHGWRLALDALAGPGDAILVESPTYPNAIHALRTSRARVVSMPLRADGWDLETFDALLRRDVPRLAYLVPDFQNPTGLLMPQEDRAAILASAARGGTHVVVDETFAALDLEPGGRMPPPMAAFATDASVISVGSMSKSFWGGLRIGWVRCSAPLARRLTSARAGLDLASPILDQLVSLRLLRSSGEILRERRALVRLRRETLVGTLRRELAHWRFRVPRGGLCLWVDVGTPDAEALADAAAADGVAIIPGPVFSADGGLDRWIRLPFTRPPDELETAVTRLRASEHRIAAGARRVAERAIA